MGRAGLLAVAVVLGLASTASAETVRQCSWYAPEQDPADRVSGPLDVGFTTFGTHRSDIVSSVELLGWIPPTTASVRLTIRDSSGIEPPQIAVLDPRDAWCDLPVAYKGEVLVAVELGDANGHYIDPFYVMREGHGYDKVIDPDQELFHWFGVGALFALLSLIAVLRRIHRGTNGEVPLVISRVLAETLARRARSRESKFAIFMVLAGLATWTLFGTWVIAGSVWILACLSDYYVTARALSLLERPHAIAELYGTNLVVRSDDHTSAILLSRRAIKRAKSDALPRASVQ